MNKILNFAITNRNIHVDTRQIAVIGDNADYIARFKFDDDWENEEVKIFKMVFGNECVEIVLDGNECVIPKQVLKKGVVSCGVYNETKATKICSFVVTESILEKEQNKIEPSKDIFDQILDKVQSVFAKLKQYVKTVNGVEPDESGNVELEVTVDAYTKAESDAKYQNKGNYALESDIPDVSGLATKGELTEAVTPLKEDLTEVEKELESKVTSTDYATSTKGGVITVASGYGLDISGAGALRGISYNAESYPSLANNSLLSKGTIENAIGGTSGIVHDTDIATTSKVGLVKGANSYGTNIGSDGTIEIERATDANIMNRDSRYKPIVPYNLEKAVTSVIDVETGTSEQVTFVEEKDLEHYVKDTDYASESKTGTVKVTASYGLNVASDGFLRGVTLEAWRYNNGENALMVSKGTLENIKEDLVNSVADKKFELIVSVTVTEEVSEIVVNTESNGSPLRVKKGVAQLMVPAHTGSISTQGAPAVKFAKSDGTVVLGGNSSSQSASSYAQYREAIFNTDNGSANFILTGIGDSGDSLSSVAGIQKIRETFSSSITYAYEFYAKTYANSVFPVGTRLRVYGVRA